MGESRSTKHGHSEVCVPGIPCGHPYTLVTSTMVTPWSDLPVGQQRRARAPGEASALAHLAEKDRDAWGGQVLPTYSDSLLAFAAIAALFLPIFLMPLGSGAP